MIKNESDKYKLRTFCKTTLKTSENVNIIKDKKDWDCSKLKEPKETWQVSEMYDPWLDSGFVWKSAILKWHNWNTREIWTWSV